MGQTFLDNFDEAGGSPVGLASHSPNVDDSLAGWTVDAGAATVAASSAGYMTMGNSVDNQVRCDVNQADHKLIATIGTNSTATNRSYYIRFRWTDANNYLELRLIQNATETGDNRIRLTEVVSGTPNELFAGGVGGPALARLSSYTITLLYIGTTVTLTVAGGGYGSGTEIFSETVSITTGTQVQLEQEPELSDNRWLTLEANNAETATIGTPAAASTGTRIDVVATLPNNSWSNPSVDESAISVWSTKGYGAVSVSSGAASSETAEVTAQLTLSRTLYDDEEVIITLGTDWLTDDDDNSADTASEVEVDMTGGASGPPATATGWSMGKIAGVLSAAFPVGFYADGYPFVVVGASTPNLTGTTPAETTQTIEMTSYDINGAMANPARDTGEHLVQAFDERNALASFDYYDALEAVSYPLAVSADECVVKGLSRDDFELGGENDHAFCDSFAGVHFVTAAPASPSTSLAPPFVGYDGSTTRPTPTIDFDAAVAALPSYDLSTVTSVESVSECIRRWCQPCMGRYMGRDNGGRWFVPTSFTHASGVDTGADGYGEEIVRTTADVCIHLMGDVATTAQKKELLIWMCSHGCQMYHGVVQQGEPITTPAGHDQGFLACVAAYLHYSGQSAALATLQDDFGYNEINHPFAITQDDIDGLVVHDTATSSSYLGPNKWMSRRNTVTNVSVNDVTIDETSSVVLGSEFTGLEMVNESTGEAWAITNHDRFASVFTLEAGHDVEVDDTVYCRPAYAWNVGDYDWGERMPTSSAAVYGESATYRAADTWAMQVLFLEALRIIGDVQNGDAMQGYVRRAMEADTPTDHDFPKTTENTAADEFWTAHNETILVASAASGASSQAMRMAVMRRIIERRRERRALA